MTGRIHELGAMVANQIAARGGAGRGAVGYGLVPLLLLPSTPLGGGVDRGWNSNQPRLRSTAPARNEATTVSTSVIGLMPPAGAG